MTTRHDPWLNGTNKVQQLGPTEESRPLLGAVALSPTQSGTTGPSPVLSVMTGSCQHTGPTHTMTTRYGSWHSGLRDDGPRLCGPTEESYLPVGTAALSPTCSDTTELSTTEESHLPVGTVASYPTCSNTTESTTSGRINKIVHSSMVHSILIQHHGPYLHGLVYRHPRWLMCPMVQVPMTLRQLVLQP